MKKQEMKIQKISGRDASKMQRIKHPHSQKPEQKTHKPLVYNEYDEMEILQEFFTHPNYLEDYEA